MRTRLARTLDLIVGIKNEVLDFHKKMHVGYLHSWNRLSGSLNLWLKREAFFMELKAKEGDNINHFMKLLRGSLDNEMT